MFTLIQCSAHSPHRQLGVKNIYNQQQIVPHVTPDERPAAVQMVYGAYDWELAGRVKASINALPAAARPKTPHQGLFLAADEQHPHPRPLRPLPTLPLAEMSLGQFSVALSHLLAAAIALGRAIAWPALPCPDLQRLVQELDRAPWFFEGVRPSGSGVVPYPVSNQPIGAHTAEPDREVIRELNGQVDVSKQVCLWYEYMWVREGWCSPIVSAS